MQYFTDIFSENISYNFELKDLYDVEKSLVATSKENAGVDIYGVSVFREEGTGRVYYPL